MTDTYAAARAALIASLPIFHAAALAASSKRSNHIRGLRILLSELQGGICAGCGRELAGRVVELCHINPSSNPRAGYEIANGNVYAGCKSCNAYDQGKNGAEIVASMARPDVVVTTGHPDRQACLAAAASDVETVAAIRNAIAAE